MAERKMADALDELYNDGVKAKMKDFIIENIDTIVAQLAGKYLTQADAQSQFASINSALSGKLGTTAKAASATTADSASKVTGGTIQLTGSVTGSGNVNISTSGGGSNISLLSSTGSSTTAGMTQKAITDELNNRANSSDLNNKLDKSTWEQGFNITSQGKFHITPGVVYLDGGILLFREADSGSCRIVQGNDGILWLSTNNNTNKYHFNADGIYLDGKKITN